jgi:hypothetical protein
MDNKLSTDAKKDNTYITKIVHSIKLDNPSTIAGYTHTKSCCANNEIKPARIPSIETLSTFPELKGFTNIAVLVEMLYPQFCVSFYDFVKREVVRKYNCNYEDAFFIYDNKLFIIEKKITHEGDMKIPMSRERIMTIFPEMKEYWSRLECGGNLTIKKCHNDIAIHYYNYKTEKTETDICDRSWNVIMTVTGNIECSCQKDVVVFSCYDVKSRSIGSYYDMNKRELIDTGYFIQWNTNRCFSTKEMCAIEYNVAQKCLTIKEFTYIIPTVNIENKCRRCEEKLEELLVLVSCGHTQICRKCVNYNYDHCPICNLVVNNLIKLQH